MDTIAPAVDSAAVRTVPEHHRFAELAARTGLEPELAQRYATDPVAVLAEFGLPAAEPLYSEPSLVIEDLDRADLATMAAPTYFCSPDGPLGCASGPAPLPANA